jgi:hypothetical protein
VSRNHNFYVTPKRLYLEDPNFSGPLDGLTYLFFGKHYRKNNKVFKKYFIEKFLREWNDEVDKKYRVSQETNFKEAIPTLEQWAIGHVIELLRPRKWNDAYLFELESCLCNWQKGK